MTIFKDGAKILYWSKVLSIFSIFGIKVLTSKGKVLIEKSCAARWTLYLWHAASSMSTVASQLDAQKLVGSRVRIHNPDGMLVDK